MKHSFLLSVVVLFLGLAACQSNGSATADRSESTLSYAITDSVWSYSEWISAVDTPIVTDTVYDGTRAADGASWFVMQQTNPQEVVRAVWLTTGLGVYDLYLNGERVGDEILKPGFTHYQKTKRSFTYDITAAFHRAAQARNTLAAEVTPGWWADKIITPAETKGMYGHKCAFRSVLKLTYTDSTVAYIGTDTIHWRAGIAGPIVHAAIYDGEEYDARHPMGYEVAESMSVPEVNHEFKGNILPTNGAEVYLRYDLAMTPQCAYIYDGVTEADSAHYGKVHILRSYHPDQPMTIAKGETLVVDFGQNCAAVPLFMFEAAEGTRLTFAGGELLNDSLGAKQRGMDGPEGSVHRDNLRISDSGVILHYTFAASDKPVTYHPTHTFFGYRYAAITATDKVIIHSLQSLPVSSLTKESEIGTIRTGNNLINRLISNTLWGQRSNYLSVPTDCPQRNERLGWTADTQIYALTGAFFANTNAFFHKWLQDLRDTQKANGGYPGVAPFGQYGATDVDMARVGWSDAGVIVPWSIWKQYGDTTILSEHWSSMERYMNHIAEYKYDHTAMFADNGGYQWGDWLSYEALESFSGQAWDANGLRPEAAEYWSYLGASYWLIDSRMMIDMARALGKDTTRYSTMAAEARAYLQERFIRQDGTFVLEILNAMQTPAVFALYNHLVEGDAKQAMKDRLRENIRAHGGCLQTGFLGTSILMATLTANDMTDVAYDLLFQRKNPSWLYSVDNGATTIWERWNSYTIEYGMASNGMNSFNHYAYGSVCQWLWESAAGIASDANDPGFKHIILSPQPDKRLGYMDAEYRSAAGTIRSAWHYKGDTWVWTFTIPQGAVASVTLPTQTERKDYQAGTYTISMHL